MSDCQDRPTFFPEALWKALMSLPALRYMKAPVNTEAELYEKYSIGNEKGTFAFVHNENTFYTYHPRGWHRGEWKPISADGISSFFEIDAEFLKDGDVLVWDNNKQKFVVKSGNVWNNLINNIKDSFYQVTKFLNLVDSIPTEESDSGLYFVYSEIVKGIYVVIDRNVKEIFNSTWWFTKEEIDSKFQDVNTQIGNLVNLGILKTYLTYADMLADINSPIGDNGNPILDGQLVSVNDITGTEEEKSNNGIYAYSVKNGVKNWVLRSSIVIPEITNQFKIISNSEYLFAIIDAEDKILFGVRLNGGLYYPSSDVSNGIIEDVAELKKIVDAIVQQLSDRIISNSEFLFAIVDTEGKILFAILHDGNVIFKENSNEVIAELQSIFKVEEDEFYLEVKKDKEGRILHIYKLDGTFCPSKMNLPENSIAQILSVVGGSINVESIDHSNKTSFAIPMPKSICYVFVYAPIEEITAKEQKVKGYIEFFDYSGNYFKKFIKIGWQGSSSIAFPRKNFSFDLYNDEECTSACEIRFGTWVFRDGFHLKVNYNDAFQTRNVNFARLAEDIYQTRPFHERYPYSVDMDINDSSLEDRMPSGAMCHIDGFIVNLYINGELNGIATWNLSKHRSNYQMKKDNLSQVLMEMSNKSKIIPPIDWRAWEIRNPKMKNIEGDWLDEGQEPEEGLTKDIINSFFDWVGSFCISIKDGRYYAHGENTTIDVIDASIDNIRIGSNGNWYIREVNTGINYIPTEHTSDSLKSLINSRMPSKFWVDFFILHDFIKNGDSISKNTLLSTYNGITWYPNSYDMDVLAGLGGGWQGVKSNVSGGIAGFNTTGIHCQPVFALYYTLFFDEIKARYKELRNMRVLDANRILNMHSDFINSAGIDAFKENFKIWNELPNNRSNNVNEVFWSFVYETNNSIPVWDDTTNYTTGDKVRLSGINVIFTAKQANTGENPLLFTYNYFPQVGGFYSGMSHLHTFLTNQISYLDNYYN